MPFPYKDENDNIHVEASYTTPSDVHYKCPFCFTNKNGTGPTGYDAYHSPLTKAGTVAKHRINEVHKHSNLCHNPEGGAGACVAELGRGDTDNWVDGPKSPHCRRTYVCSDWQSICPSICNNNVYVHVTENTRRFGMGKKWEIFERYKQVLMPNFTYPTLKNSDGEFVD